MISKLSSFLTLTTLAFSSLGVVTGLHIRNVTDTQLEKRDYTNNIYYYGEDAHFGGACNTMIDNSVLVAGIDSSSFNTNRCGMYIMIMYYDDSGNSASKFAKVETECYGCAPGDLVVTPSVFGSASAFHPVKASWSWNPEYRGGDSTTQ